MINAIKINEVVKNADCEYFEIARKHDTIDALWGLEYRVLTDNDIKALKEGKYLYCNNGEYAQIISYEPQESED
jgi:hypothetical protein